MPPFEFARLFAPSFHVLSSFYVPLSLVTVFTNVDKLRDTAPLSHPFLSLHEASVIYELIMAEKKQVRMLLKQCCCLTSLLIYFVLLCIKSK